MKIHTPYDGSHKPFTIGLKPLDPREWIEVDAELARYLAEKHRLYAEETANVLVAEAGTEAAQQEVLDMLVEYLPSRFPGIYRHAASSITITPPQSDQLEIELDAVGKGKGAVGDALALAGLLIQEDLVLMRHSPDGWRLVAASLCFPSAWNLREKFGKPMHAIHQPVPGFGEGTRNAGLIDRMFDNLRVEQPVIRWNWSFYGDATLYHPATDNKMKNRFGEGPITGRVVLRLERQTLRKLPKSGDILFGIRIYNHPLEVLQTHPDGRELAKALVEQVEAFTPEEIEYKGLVNERTRLLERLRQFL